MRVAVLGAGSWGTALSAMLADAGHAVTLWGRDRESIRTITATRENARYLPGRRLPAGVQVTDLIDEAAAGAELAVVALPTACVREVALAAFPFLAVGTVVVCASKGLEESSRLTLDRVLGEALPGLPIVLFSGPTFAIEVAQGLPAAAVAASTDAPAAATVQQAFASDRFRVYTTEDVTGVAIGGALKNVVAIAAGCADGLRFGSNARAALITRGLNEMGRLAARMGGNPLTLSGLAGLGDLVLTCTGELSRNRKVGLALAAGQSLPAIVAGLGQVAEGISTARIANDLAHDLGVQMPITTQVAAVLAGERTAQAAVVDLLSRESRPERG